jgi:hypothetical protein
LSLLKLSASENFAHIGRPEGWHRGADDADLDALHEGLSRRISLSLRSPLPALAPAPGRNTRLIRAVFLDVPRRARKAQGLHQFPWADAFFEGHPGEEEAVGVRLVDLRQAEEGEMDLRQRLFARALKFTGAANLFDSIRRDRRGKGGGQQRKEARLFAIECETARRPAFLFELRENRAAPKREARLGKCHFTMKGAA